MSTIRSQRFLEVLNLASVTLIWVLIAYCGDGSLKNLRFVEGFFFYDERKLIWLVWLVLGWLGYLSAVIVVVREVYRQNYRTIVGADYVNSILTWPRLAGRMIVARFSCTWNVRAPLIRFGNSFLNFTLLYRSLLVLLHLVCLNLHHYFLSFGIFPHCHKLVNQNSIHCSRRLNHISFQNNIVLSLILRIIGVPR